MLYLLSYLSLSFPFVTRVKRDKKVVYYYLSAAGPASSSGGHTIQEDTTQ